MGDIQYGLAWQDKYKLGDKKVDAQHRQLFELLSELIKSCMDGTDVEKLHVTLDFLVDYTVKHFYDEESLQVYFNYPDYLRHKQLHEDFKGTVGEIVAKFNRDGSSAELSRDLSKIVALWLVQHITIEDKKIGEYLRTLDRRSDFDYVSEGRKRIS
ncbi:MAG: hemerythrin family protein [Clostridiales bacterium]|jgi:hemerythrin|nr:hemerythrin family protein [Clostridiales bacterium]